jgi:DNA replication and repair protein RecF
LTLKNLRLVNFRNYTDSKVEFSPNLNILWGDNAQGKSNLLEAIYYLGHGRSYRLVPDDQVLQWDRHSFVIQAAFFQEERQAGLEIIYSSDPRKKSINYNGTAITRLDKLGRIFPVVLFSPDDLTLVKGAPNYRRHYLDSLLSRIYPDYAEAVYRYHRLLSQRNHLMKQPDNLNNRSLLETMDQELSKPGALILAYRLCFLPCLGRCLRKYFGELAQAEAELSMLYASSLTAAPNSLTALNAAVDPKQAVSKVYDSLGQKFLKTLYNLRTVDRHKGVTTIGPQRDDLVFRLEGKNLRQFGSQGQQRSMVLALRLSELELMHQFLRQRPVLLLDDVFSELDPKRCAALLNLFNRESQVFITTANKEYLPAPVAAKAVFYQIRAGFIS